MKLLAFGFVLALIGIAMMVASNRVDRRTAKSPTTYPNGVPLPPLNTPIPQDFLIDRTYNQAASSGYRTDLLFTDDTANTGIVYRPMDFQIDGQSVAHVSRRGGALIYVINGIEVTREKFYEFMDLWLQRQAGIGTDRVHKEER